MSSLYYALLEIALALDCRYKPRGVDGSGGNTGLESRGARVAGDHVAGGPLEPQRGEHASREYERTRWTEYARLVKSS